MTVDHNPKHVEQARSDLLSQYRGKPRIEALVKSLAGAAGVQQLEDELDYSRTLQTLDEIPTFSHPDLTASENEALREDKLKQWGRLVGVRKGDLTLSEYVRFVKARIQANYSEGRRNEITRIFALLTDADSVWYSDHYPGAYELTAFKSSNMRQYLRDRVDEVMNDVRPAGVGYSLVEGSPKADAFRFDVSGQGFDNGKMTRVF